jgi:hypothetical protein
MFLIEGTPTKCSADGTPRNNGVFISTVLELEPKS